MRDPKPFRDRLRQGDPARPMAPEEAGRIRQIVLREAARGVAPEPEQRPFRWQFAAAMASAVALAVSLGWGLRERPEVTVPEELARPRQIQFETPGGTRIIWVLQPGENLSR
ncbi:MAG TPA: hypothetical protein VL025_03900 [Thermoanaerobaculia bacterium]|nr:hypothetical protein [Thermoanaerobaculia bacterium]